MLDLHQYPWELWLIKYKLDIQILVNLDAFLVVSQPKWLAHFLLKRNNKNFHEKLHFPLFSIKKKRRKQTQMLCTAKIWNHWNSDLFSIPESPCVSRQTLIRRRHFSFLKPRDGVKVGRHLSWPHEVEINDLKMGRHNTSLGVGVRSLLTSKGLDNVHEPEIIKRI